MDHLRFSQNIQFSRMRWIGSHPANKLPLVNWNARYEQSTGQRAVFRWVAGGFLVLTGLLILSGGL